MAPMAEMHAPAMVFYGLAMTVFSVVKAAQHGLHFSFVAGSIFGALLVAWGAYSWATGRARLRLSIGVPLSIIGTLAAVMLWVQFSVEKVLLEFWLVLGVFLLVVLLAHYPEMPPRMPPLLFDKNVTSSPCMRISSAFSSPVRRAASNPAPISTPLTAGIPIIAPARSASNDHKRDRRATLVDGLLVQRTCDAERQRCGEKIQHGAKPRPAHSG